MVYPNASNAPLYLIFEQQQNSPWTPLKALITCTHLTPFVTEAIIGYALCFPHTCGPLALFTLQVLKK